MFDDENNFAPAPIRQITTLVLPLEWASDIKIKGSPYAYYPIMPKNGVVHIVGDSGAHKTSIATDFACLFSLGLKWCDIDCEASGNVLFVAGEGEMVTRRRVKGWSDVKGITPNVAICPKPLFIQKTEVLEELIEAVKREEFSCIIFDSLAANMMGDENSGEHMQDFCQACREIGRNSGRDVLVLVIHHTGKDRSKGGRGHSARLAEIDGELSIAKGAMALRASGKVSKNRDGPDGQEFYFELGVHTFEGTVDQARPITAPYVMTARVNSESVLRKKPPSAAGNLALRAIKETYCSDKDIALPASKEKTQLILANSRIIVSIAKTRERYEDLRLIKEPNTPRATIRSSWRNAKDDLINKQYIKTDEKLIWLLP